METEGLIIGLDLQECLSQACYYNTSHKTIQTVMFEDNKSVFLHPDIFSDIYQAEKNNEPINLDQLVYHISYLIELVRNSAGSRKIQKICITVSCFEITILDAIRAAMGKLQLEEEQWTLISHEECYAYYVYSQGKDLYRGGVMLLDYQRDGLHTFYMTNRMNNGTEYILEQAASFQEEELTDVVEGKRTFREVEERLITHMNQVMGQRIISSIYLTGPGFENQQFSERFTQSICHHRKAFTGQNLYVKGACICACEEVNPDRFEHTILGCGNRVTTGIEVDIMERGQKKRLRIVRPGVNWYMAGRTMDFILEDMSQITFVMRPCDQQEEYNEIIDISDFPYREGKMTRITLDVKFHADDRCLVTVIDRGFGEFAESSGKVIHKELEMR